MDLPIKIVISHSYVSLPIQFVDLPINSMVISHRFLYVYQAGYILKISKDPSQIPSIQGSIRVCISKSSPAASDALSTSAITPEGPAGDRRVPQVPPKGSPWRRRL